jgi:nicotinate-nucleotide adenylyltransferase
VEAVGIYGGTFDPIHYGHLAIAEEVRWALGLAHLFVVPAAQQPLKSAVQGAGPQQRLTMVRLACADNPTMTVSDMEIERPPPSYTVDTLRAFRSILGPQVTLFFVLGADALEHLGQWREKEALLDLARLAVVQRPGTTLDLAGLEQDVPGISRHVTLIDGPKLDISGTEIRRRLAANMPVRYQIPEAVHEYIALHGLYRKDSNE